MILGAIWNLIMHLIGDKADFFRKTGYAKIYSSGCLRDLEIRKYVHASSTKRSDVYFVVSGGCS